MILKQDGNQVAGRVGPNDEEPLPFEGGKVEGNAVLRDSELPGDACLRELASLSGSALRSHVFVKSVEFRFDSSASSTAHFTTMSMGCNAYGVRPIVSGEDISSFPVAGLRFSRDGTGR